MNNKSVLLFRKMLTELSKDELFLIAMKLDCPSLLKFCMCNKRIYEKIYLRKDVWTHKLKDFSDRLDITNDKYMYILLYQLKIIKEKFNLHSDLSSIYTFKYFPIRDRNFSKIPKEICILKNLEEISVYSTVMIEIPKWLDKLTRLHFVDFGSNKIRKIPESFGNLINLKAIQLNNNQIEILPKEFGNLINLEYIDLSNNLIKYIPKHFGNLINLNVLKLSNNYINKLPVELSRLTNLTDFHLIGNPIKYIPKELRDLPIEYGDVFQSNE